MPLLSSCQVPNPREPKAFRQKWVEPGNDEVLEMAPAWENSRIAGPLLIGQLGRK
jgi:hypothetical protein